MTADKFRDAVGVERARIIAMGCEYSRAYWSNACTHSREIPSDRIACMLNKLENTNRRESKFIRDARKELAGTDTPPDTASPGPPQIHP